MKVSAAQISRICTVNLYTMMSSLMNVFLAVVIIVLPMKALAFTKVLVPSVYKEWQHGKPLWATDPVVQKKFNYTVFTYQKLDPDAPNYFGYNRGTETGVYLKYVVDHYDNFPDVAIFVHAKPHEHQPSWLHMIGCINPNATWFNINHGYSPWITRGPEYWEEDAPVQEQCWRDVIQIILGLKGNLEEFHRRFPPTKPFTMQGTCCNQFLVSRAMIHKRPLRVWRELLNIIAIQPTCHLGDFDYENLYAFNQTGRVKTTEQPYYEKFFKESAAEQKGSYVQGHAGEHLNHVVFGHKAIEMTPPTQEDLCQNFIRGCPGSPCKGPPPGDFIHVTVLVAVKVGRADWYMVLHKGKRHNVPDMDTRDGLEVSQEDVLQLDMADIKYYPEGPALTPCDKTWVPNTCMDSVYYKALHNIRR